MTFIIVLAGVLFLFGLVQWARSGAALWDIRRLLKYGASSNFSGASNEKREENSETVKKELQKSVQELESLTDGLLRSSFRVLGVLAICIWLFIVASVVIDILGLDWLDRLSFTPNRIWGNPAARAGGNQVVHTNGNQRNNTLRHLGSGLRNR